MSRFSDLARRAKKLVKENPEQVTKGIDRAADLADKQTKGRHRSKIDKGAAAAKGAVNKLGNNRR
jgi:hypothetical protein